MAFDLQYGMIKLKSRSIENSRVNGDEMIFISYVIEYLIMIFAIALLLAYVVPKILKNHADDRKTAASDETAAFLFTDLCKCELVCNAEGFTDEVVELNGEISCMCRHGMYIHVERFCDELCPAQVIFA